MQSSVVKVVGDSCYSSTTTNHKSSIRSIAVAVSLELAVATAVLEAAVVVVACTHFTSFCISSSKLFFFCVRKVNFRENLYRNLLHFYLLLQKVWM